MPQAGVADVQHVLCSGQGNDLLRGVPVVITGAGSGLGRAYALDCARAEASVVVNDVRPEAAEETCDLIRGAGGDAMAVHGSVGDWDAARGLIESCVARYGWIGGLVNNAGVLHAATIWEENEASLRGIVEVNLLGTMFCGVHAMSRFVLQGSGVIVNVTSSVHLGSARVSAYGATKGAITSLTYAWAIEGEAHGVRVNAVSPLARTPILEAWDGNAEQREARQHYATPDDVAPVVTFLLSAASAPLTGQVVRADGRSVIPLRRSYFDAAAAVAMPGTPAQLVAGLARRPGPK
jgi:NAD(P)-dependent dehydrogenase (short-subunit alcohol dehydrogenase family)